MMISFNTEYKFDLRIVHSYSMYLILYVLSKYEIIEIFN